MVANVRSGTMARTVALYGLEGTEFSAADHYFPQGGVLTWNGVCYGWAGPVTSELAHTGFCSLAKSFHPFRGGAQFDDF